MSRWKILVVDDEVGMLEVCKDTLAHLSDVAVYVEVDSQMAAERLENERFDMLISDIRMPKIDGMELVRIGREVDPDLIVLVLTAFPSVDTAVQSLKLGVTDYITKPFVPDDLLATVDRLLKTKRLTNENRLLQKHIERSYIFDEMIGKSSAMQTIFDSIQRIAETDVDVLIQGETGTGKELVARSIHTRSQRRDGKFVPVDCAAIPEQLLESEFFGHERGAFTGANRQSMGLIEFADGGTFFLDEIGELPLTMQAKLLRVVQERKFRRVGGTEEIDVDVRIVAATNRDLEAELREQRFREDLFYRINVARIDLPSLRERGDDVELLVEHFMQRFSKEMKRENIKIDDDALDILVHYPWPGNVRELQNTLKRMMALLVTPIITLDLFSDEMIIKAGEHDRQDDSFFALKEKRIATFEKEYFNTLLLQYKGDVTAVTRKAKMPRGTIYRLFKKYKIHPDDFR